VSLMIMKIKALAAGAKTRLSSHLPAAPHRYWRPYQKGVGDPEEGHE